MNNQRWYWHADRLGIVVLQDMIQKYGGATQATVPLFYDDLRRMIYGRGNHPSIVQWTLFNEDDEYDNPLLRIHHMHHCHCVLMILWVGCVVGKYSIQMKHCL